ncbi:MAG: (d)CMP kinase [Clostridiaceae bacterium]|nr:(d)CMP kinase [Clostridiaceae bacterium]
MNHISVAIDGPSGAGKSTIARAAAKALGFLYVDTGALYRAIGLAVCREGYDALDRDEVISVLPHIQVELRYLLDMQRVYLNGEDVSDLIRTPQIAQFASRVSAVPEVRTFLLDLQRDMAARNSVIMDGRDIGTVILPHAEVKIFLTASAEKRAERRCAELKEKGQPVELTQVLADMAKRDALDAARAVAPLKQADDAVLVDTSSLTLEESIQAVLRVIRKAQQV